MTEAVLAPMTASPAAQRAAKRLIALLRDRVGNPTPGTIPDIAVSILRDEGVSEAEAKPLLDLLHAAGVGDAFLRQAASRSNDALFRWIERGGISWLTVYTYYEFGPSDGADFFFGFLAGAGYSTVDLSGLLTAVQGAAQFQQMMMVGTIVALLDKGLTGTAKLYFGLLEQLIAKLEAVDFPAIIQQEFAQWQESLWKKLFRLRYFDAGFQVGELVGIIVQLVAAGVGLAKIAPKLAKAAATVAAQGLKMAVRTVEDIAPFVKTLRALGAAQFRSLPNLTRSPYLWTMISPAELKNVVASGKKLHVTDGGMEFIRVSRRELGFAPEPVPVEGPSFGGRRPVLESKDLYVVRDKSGEVVGTVEHGALEPEFFRDAEKRIDALGADAPNEKITPAALARRVERELERVRGLLRGMMNELDALRDTAADSPAIRKFLGVTSKEKLTVAKIEEIARGWPYDKAGKTRRFRLTGLFGSSLHQLMKESIDGGKFGRLFPGLEFKAEVKMPALFKDGTPPRSLGETVKTFATENNMFAHGAFAADVEKLPKGAKRSVIQNLESAQASFLKRHGGKTIGTMSMDFVALDAKTGEPVMILDWASMRGSALEEAADLARMERQGVPRTLLADAVDAADLSKFETDHFIKTWFYTFYLGIEKSVMIQAGEFYSVALHLY